MYCENDKGSIEHRTFVCDSKMIKKQKKLKK